MSKKLFLLVVLVVAVLFTGCTDPPVAQEAETTEIQLVSEDASSEGDQAVALSKVVTEEVENLSEACQLGALWQQVGNDSKIKFLAKIHEGCQEDGREIEWSEKWDEVSDVGWVEYESAQ